MTLERKAELAQQTFRRLMDSMAKPGTINELPDDCELTQGELTKGLGAVINTFLDHEVSYSVIGKGPIESLIEEASVISRAHYVPSEQADYVIITGGSSDNGIQYLKTGTLEYPEDSATVFYLVDSLGLLTGPGLKIRGPGVKDVVFCSISGIDQNDIVSLSNINHEYPIGLDVILLDKKGWVLGLPRTAQISWEG